MFAVIKTGGKQYKVSEGKKLKIEKIDVKDGASFDFDSVLLIADEKSADISLGNPYLKGAKVSAKVLANSRAKKIDVIKYKNKIRYRKKTGHRQYFTEVQIDKITA
jgi:large subunit ribosomal protein L21